LEGVIAAVFSQEWEGWWLLVAYYSKTLSLAEANYEIYNKKLLAII
jgi:hypothetical protein